MKNWSKYKIGLVAYIAFGVAIVLNGLFSDSQGQEQKTELSGKVENLQTQNNSETVEVSNQTQEIKEQGEVPEIKEEQKTELYKVVNVVDGDTIDVELDGAKQRLRLIGLDTPETVDPRKPVQCFGKEASGKAKELLLNKMVNLEADSSQGEEDKYSRLLRYVFLEDGTNFNELMIKEGYAHEYTYNLPYKYQEKFKQAEKEARGNKRGLWGDICLQPEPNPIPVVTPAPAPVTKQSGYTCNCSKTCPQMGCAEAQYQLNVCGCSRRDADEDGTACDSQCQ